MPRKKGDPMGTIVVGIDGSNGSQRALEWALTEAKLRGDEILALHAWTYPTVVGTAFATVVMPLPAAELDKEAAEFLQREIKEVTGGDESVVIRREVAQDPAASALVRASAEADMLVIGSRGFGGFRGLLLGSVGHQCVQHAVCPIVIIPHDERTTPEEAGE